MRQEGIMLASHGSRQGKCGRCRVVFEWPGRTPRVSDAHCPRCGARLAQTTYLSKLPRVYDELPTKWSVA